GGAQKARGIEQTQREEEGGGDEQVFDPLPRAEGLDKSNEHGFDADYGMEGRAVPSSRPMPGARPRSCAAPVAPRERKPFTRARGSVWAMALGLALPIASLPADAAAPPSAPS